MMLFVYRIGTWVFGTIALPIVLGITVFSPRWRQGIVQRLGFVPKHVGEKRLLIHAASVGEVHGASALIAKISKRIGVDKIVISTMTPTGNDEAKKRFPNHHVCFFPADAGAIPSLWLRRLNVDRVILFETELWPIFLAECASMGIPAAMINARISDRSFPRYRFFNFFLRRFWARLCFAGAQNESYAKRLIDLGVDPKLCRVTGNIKFDSFRQSANVKSEIVEMVRGFKGEKRLLVFASTHDGEEALIHKSLQVIFQEFSDVAAILAPRHKERFDAVWRLVKGAIPNAVRRSEWDAGNQACNTRLMLLDTLGELSSCFPAATAAFVGGSMVNVGGHNLLEPAAFGVPVISGTHTQNFQTEMRLLNESGGIITVNNGEELTEALRRLLSNESDRDRIGAAAEEAVENGGGTLAKTMDLLAEHKFF